MTHWKKLKNPDYFGSWAIEGEDVHVTIKEVKTEMVANMDGKKELCTVVFFKEDVKPLILNSTNAKAITKLHGTPHIEEWAGKRISLYSAKVKAFGEVVDAVRIRPIAPTTTKEQLTPKHSKWKSACDSLSEGKTTIEVIQSYYDVSEADLKTLKKLLPNA